MPAASAYPGTGWRRPVWKDALADGLRPDDDSDVASGLAVRECEGNIVTTATATSWQYAYEIIENSEINKRLHHVLNWRGSEGWELVSLAPRVKPVLGAQQGGDMVAVFKRPGVGPFDAKIAMPGGDGWS